MKKILIIILATACLCACSKNSAVEGETVDMSKLIGKWVDVSDQHYGYSSDSAVYYTFNEDGTCLLTSYHALEGNNTTDTYKYTFTINDGLTIIKDESDATKNSNYIVLKLDDSEMKWQSTSIDLQKEDYAYVYLSRITE